MSINVPITTAPLSSTKLDKVHSDLMKASEQFESYFVDQMLKEMRKSIPHDGELGDSDNQQAIFTDMSDQAVADSVSKQGSFGIAEMLYRDLSKSLPPNDPAKAVSTYASAAPPSRVDVKQ